ncbi:MAG: sugar kinase [Bacteroidetes bacterium]|nr:sugar kinase [Bacteroidota bacterium]MCY4204753.1 sugar kinase [Bacteroidota bacterium]
MKRCVTFGEIMLRLSPPGFERFAQASSFDARYGGAEANVAASLSGYGIPVTFVSRVPENELGTGAIQTLRSLAIDTRFIERGGDRLGIYFLETGASARASKVIYDRAHSGIASITPGMIDWNEVFAGAGWFHWTGITPAISETAALTIKEALDAAKRHNVIISVDLNYRKLLWQWGKTPEDVMTEFVSFCDVIVGNEEDAQKVFGIHPEGVEVRSGHLDASAYESVGKQLMNRFPRCKRAVITLRSSISASHNNWSAVLWDGSNLLHAPSYEITPIVDRVGGGDAFVGGLIYGLLTFQGDNQKSLDFGVAASCLKHTIPGDFNLVTVAEVQKLLAGDASGRVSR